MPFLLKHDWDNAYQLPVCHTIAGIFSQDVIRRASTSSDQVSAIFHFVRCIMRLLAFSSLVNGIFASRLNRKLPTHQVLRQDTVETRSKHVKTLPKNQTYLILKTRSSIFSVSWVFAVCGLLILPIFWSNSIVSDDQHNMFEPLIPIPRWASSHEY